MLSKNNLSFWFPKIKDCGIKVPETTIISVPEDVQRYFYLSSWNKDEQAIIEWVEQNVKPLMAKKVYFLKNAVFSNKFNFQSCITRSTKIADDIIGINYAALCLGAMGLDEIILREIIPHDIAKVPTIYSGMPLRSEFRVFYDFDKHVVLYSANYWDFDYCSPKMYDKTDKIVFDYMRSEISEKFIANQKHVEELVGIHMKDVDLNGKWSIDILLDGHGAFWLIDMAVAQNSVYWDKTYE